MRPRTKLPKPSELVFSCLGGGRVTWRFWSVWWSGCSWPWFINIIGQQHCKAPPVIHPISYRIQIMHDSRRVSEFALAQKHTPNTALSPPSPLNTTLSPNPSCSFCAEHLAKVSELRKREILLELDVERLKEEVRRLEREKEELITARVLSYGEYQQKEEMQGAWNRQDLEAELFQARIIIELLLVSKGVPTHPQLQQLDIQALRQKYSDALMENLRLQQKVMVRDRIIEERNFFPIYHYDQRVSTLRKAMVHWYRKAEEECLRMRTATRNLKLGITHQMENMKQMITQHMQENKTQLASILEKQPIRPTRQEKKEREKERKGKVGKEVETRKIR